MNNLTDSLKKYVRMTPQTFSYTMIGLSTAVLVFFIAYKDDDNPKLEESNSDDKPSKMDDELPEEDKTLPEEDEEQYNFEKNEEPMRVGGSRSSRSSRSLYKDKSKHSKNANTRKKGNKKHK